MGMELLQLRYAVTTADSKSFARAAAALLVKQSTLSRRVKEL
jgi:DNA-binding transcriptional LysR family regulator